MTTQDTSVVFTVGVAQDPATQSHLEALAKSVERYQQQMRDGIASLGGAAASVKDSVTSIGDLGGRFESVRTSVDGLRSSLGSLHKDGAVLPANIANAFKELGGSTAEVDKLQSAIDEKLAGLPQSAAANTALLRQEYQRRVKDQAKAHDVMKADWRKAVDDQSQAIERLNANIAKGAKSAVGAMKGFATLGLVSEESSQKMLKGLVAIEGAVNIFDGMVDGLEAVTAGWKSLRKATEAAAEAGKLARGLSVGKAASNGVSSVGSLAMGVGSVAVPSVVAPSVATRAAITGAGAATAGASATAGTAAGGAVTSAGAGFIATAGAAAAALAAVGLVAWELKEILTGTANEQGSVTNSIAEWEVGLGAGILRMTGLFEKADAPMVKFMNSIGGMSGAVDLAVSQAGVERAEKRLAVQRVTSKFGEERTNLNRDASNKLAGNEFGLFENRTRSYADLGSTDDKIGAEMQIQSRAAQEMAKYQQEAAIAAAEQGRTSEAYKDSIAMVDRLQDAITGSYAKQRALVNEKARTELQAQERLQDSLKRQIELRTQEIDKVATGYQSAASNFARLGDVEKDFAKRAIEQARQMGASSLNDTQKDLLRNIGSDEATKFANEADLIEARQFGFDRSFGGDFKRQRLQLESTRQTLQAELSTSYDTTVDIKFDESKVVRSLVDQALPMIEQKNQEIARQVAEQLKAAMKENSDQLAAALSQLKNSRR